LRNPTGSPRPLPKALKALRPGAPTPSSRSGRGEPVGFLNKLFQFERPKV